MVDLNNVLTLTQKEVRDARSNRWFILFAVAFAGRHLFKVYAIEQNWFDYARSGPDNNFFAGSLAGDNFERPIFNIKGGIGLFGAAAVDSLGFFVEAAPEE